MKALKLRDNRNIIRLSSVISTPLFRGGALVRLGVMGRWYGIYLSLYYSTLFFTPSIFLFLYLFWGAISKRFKIWRFISLIDNPSIILFKPAMTIAGGFPYLIGGRTFTLNVGGSFASFPHGILTGGENWFHSLFLILVGDTLFPPSHLAVVASTLRNNLSPIGGGGYNRSMAVKLSLFRSRLLLPLTNLLALPPLFWRINYSKLESQCQP